MSRFIAKKSFCGDDETTNSRPLSLLEHERCSSVGCAGLKSYVLISNLSFEYVVGSSFVFAASHSLVFFVLRINKKGSQKDQEQKKAGAYFFYDDGADDAEEEEFDDI